MCVRACVCMCVCVCVGGGGGGVGGGWAFTILKYYTHPFVWRLLNLQCKAIRLVDQLARMAPEP